MFRAVLAGETGGGASRCPLSVPGGACEPWREAQLAYLRGNRDRAWAFVRDECGPTLAVAAAPPEASYLLWIDATRIPSPGLFLKKRGVYLTEGQGFGARGFVRAIVDKISTLVTVTQPGPLRSERMACADLSQMNAAEGAVLTAAVLPFAHERGAAAAATTSGPIAGDTDHGRFDLSQWLSGGRGGGCGGGVGSSGGGSGGSGGGGASSRQATEAALSTARRTQRSLQSAGTHGAIIGRKGRTVQTFAHPSSASELIGAETAPSTAAVGANLAVGGADDNGEEHGLAAQLHAGKGRVGTGGGSGSSPPGLLLGSTSSPGADSDVVTDPLSGVTATVRASATAHSAGTRAATARAASAVQDSNASRLASPKALPSGLVSSCRMRLSEPTLPCRADVGEEGVEGQCVG